MQRAIITPAVLPPAALAELKAWLAISTTHDDAVLTAVLRASLDLCEQFTGLVPLIATYEEVIPVCRNWHQLATRPVAAITAVAAVSVAGIPAPMAVSDYELDLGGDGSGMVRVIAPLSARRIAVRFTAGLSADWASLPDGLRHGIIRLAAHQHREREGSGDSAVPPAAVVALWRPWRRLRLA